MSLDSGLDDDLRSTEVMFVETGVWCSLAYRLYASRLGSDSSTYPGRTLSAAREVGGWYTTLSSPSGTSSETERCSRPHDPSRSSLVQLNGTYHLWHIMCLLMLRLKLGISTRGI